MNEQIWLSLEGICNVLQTSRDHIKWLVKNNYLEMIPGTVKGYVHARYLDPTPEYADRLRTAEMIYQRRQPLPADIDISGKAIFTRAEVAVLLGWSDSYAHRYLTDNRVPCVKIGKEKRGGLRLYTAHTVRGLLWRRRGYKLSSQKSPFLIKELVDWFIKDDAEELRGQPSDIDFSHDALLQKKLRAVLKMPPAQRQQAMRELWEKVDLAQDTAALLRPKAQ